MRLNSTESIEGGEYILLLFKLFWTSNFFAR